MSALFGLGHEMDEVRPPGIFELEPPPEIGGWVQVGSGVILDTSDDENVIAMIQSWVVSLRHLPTVLDPAEAFARLAWTLDRHGLQSLCISSDQYRRESCPRAVRYVDRDDPEQVCYEIEREDWSLFTAMTDVMMRSAANQMQAIEHFIEYEGERLRFLVLAGWVVGVFAA